MTDWEILRQLGGYVWPKDNPDYRWRVAGASVLLVGAKALNVTVSSLTMHPYSDSEHHIGAQNKQLLP